MGKGGGKGKVRERRGEGGKGRSKRAWTMASAWSASIGVVANLELGERSGVLGRSPQRGPRAEPLVGGQGRSPRS